MYQYFRIRGFKYAEYIGWVAGKIFFMALVYTLMEEFILKDPRDFITAFKKSVEVTALVLILPYSMLWLYFAWRENTRLLQQISGTDHSMAGSPKMIPFYD